MKTKLCLAAALLVPSFAFAECLIEFISERDNEELRADAMATCLAFYTREREFELQLMSRVLTFTNVRSILQAE